MKDHIIVGSLVMMKGQTIDLPEDAAVCRLVVGARHDDIRLADGQKLSSRGHVYYGRCAAGEWPKY